MAPFLAIAYAPVIALIAALDHFGDAIMPISQQPLMNVLSEMNAAVDVNDSKATMTRTQDG